MSGRGAKGAGTAADAASTAAMPESITYASLQSLPGGVLLGAAGHPSGQYIVQLGNQGQDDDDDDDHDDDPILEGELREQDRFLPIANVARIMKTSIPSAQGKIAKEARECVQECVSEFISFITSEAAERCQAEKRKTINGEDILCAMSTLGLENYVEPLKLYLQKYRETMKGDKQGEEFEGTSANDDLIASTIERLSASGGGAGGSGQILFTYSSVPGQQPGSMQQF